jgi:alanine racemase
MPRPIYAVIDTDAMSRNLHRIRRDVPGKRVWAVVKANAYGHGIEHAVLGLNAADGLAMLDFSEAQRCRAAGWTKPILMLEGAFDGLDLSLANTLSLSLVVHDEAGLDALEMFADAQGASFRLPAVWLKLNTGMNRLGFSRDSWSEALRRAFLFQKTGKSQELGVMSHFARADDDAGIASAMSIWCEAQAQAGVLGKIQTCLANSAATLRYAGAQADWVRSGIALYGATPFSWVDAPEYSADKLSLSPTMGLYSTLIALRDIAAGEQVGYGGSFVAAGPMRIGIVACGYADGYPRIARSGTPVWIEGKRCPTAGRVSMDMLAVDITHVPEARLGSVVELWGKRLPIDEVADCANTIGYELMCALAARVPTRVGALHG